VCADAQFFLETMTERTKESEQTTRMKVEEKREEK